MTVGAVLFSKPAKIEGLTLFVKCQLPCFRKFDTNSLDFVNHIFPIESEESKRKTKCRGLKIYYLVCDC